MSGHIKKIYRATACVLLELKHDNFGIRSQTQWWPPGARSARSEHHHLANAAQPIDELPVHAACDPAPRNELPKVGVTRHLHGNAGGFRDIWMIGSVSQENAGTSLVNADRLQ